MNNLEKNKLIAEFLCTTQKTDGLDDCYIFEGKAYHIEDLDFYSDWKWMIPVLRRIKEVFKNEQEEKWLENHLNPYLYDIEKLHSSVVELIKTYNYRLYGK